MDREGETIATDSDYMLDNSNEAFVVSLSYSLLLTIGISTSR